MMQEFKQRLAEGAVTFLTLFSSAGTLICCALPITLVTLGLGSAVVGLTGAFPWLVSLSRHKDWVFAVSALLLTVGGWMLYRRDRQCPADPKLGRLCGTLDRWNRRLYWTSVAIWATGFFAAFLLLPLTRALNGATGGGP
ncbi:MAG TPA: hypothetical protein VE175_08735 [Woeseiaceae bacterium]|jgi:hypothetical protein|nr:hypothetical protein [Woeseiaceae bacterium]